MIISRDGKEFQLFSITVSRLPVKFIVFLYSFRSYHKIVHNNKIDYLQCYCWAYLLSVLILIQIIKNNIYWSWVTVVVDKNNSRCLLFKIEWCISMQKIQSMVNSNIEIRSGVIQTICLYSKIFRAVKKNWGTQESYSKMIICLWSQ